MVPYLMTSLFILTLPCEGSPVTLAKEIEESPTITAELNVVDAEENPVADVNVILDVDVGLLIAPFNVVEVAPSTIPPHKPAPHPVPPAVELAPVLT